MSNDDSLSSGYSAEGSHNAGESAQRIGDAGPNVPGHPTSMKGARGARRGALEERYGADPLTRRNKLTGRFIVIGIVALLIGCGFYMWTQWKNSTSADVTISSAGFERKNDHLLDFTVDVTREDTSKPAYCIVSALDYDKNEVGRREFVIPASADKTQRYTVEIPTLKAAVAGQEYGCSATIPSYLKQ